MQSRFAGVAIALASAGLEVIGAACADAFVEQVRDRLLFDCPR
jgi:hypothetical protein